MKLYIASMAALAVFSTALARADASGPDPALAEAPAPKLQYRSVFQDTPTGVEAGNTDWKNANAQAGQFPRGHADLLKWEAQHAQPPASAPIEQLAQPRIGAAKAPVGTTQSTATVDELLARNPLDAETAVRIALLNNPSLQGSLATLAISDADRLAASRPANPLLTLSRVRAGEQLEIERMLSFNVINLLTLPWRARLSGQQTELAKLEYAQDVIRVAADTRKAWINAIAAAQTARYMQDAKEAAEAGAELARRMARVGNWSKLQQAREQAVLADLTAQLARSQQAAVAEREKLIRIMGLWGQQTAFALPERLPDLPAKLPERIDIERQALAERLDVRAAKDESRYVADSLGLVRATGVIDALDIGIKRNTSFDNAAGTRESGRGFELELPLPIFDWGQARTAKAQATYLQSVAKVREVAIRARSEAREAWHGWRTSYDLARHYRDEIVPLRKFISDETVLRYNGMLASVWDLLAETRNHVAAVNNAISAQREFWIADTDLNTALTGTSPGALTLLSGTTDAPAAAQGH